MLEIRTPILKRLFDDWESRRAGREMPARRDFDILDLKYALGVLSLIDVYHDPLRFRFRVHAGGIGERVGYEMTGKYVDELPPGPREVTLHHLTAVVDERRPIVQERGRQVLDNKVWHCEVVVMPLSSDAAGIDMLMTGVAWL